MTVTLHHEERLERKRAQHRKSAHRRYDAIQEMRTSNAGLNDKGTWGFHLSHVRTRARKKNIPFNLTSAYVVSIAPTHCPVLGIPLQRSKTTGAPNSPSIDRIDPALGYVIGNIIIVSKLANQIKSNATPEQIIMVGEFYKSLMEARSSVVFDPNV
jgi:hypothetical protein